MNPLAATDNLPHRLASDLKKLIVVFVPGAFHTPAHFGPLSRYLETKGCENFAIRLPSIGDRAGTSKGELADDVLAIRRVLEELVRGADGDDGTVDGGELRDPGNKDVILVMESSGAVSGCQAITSLERSSRMKEGKRGGVISLVFIGGLLVDEGESLESTMAGLGEKVLPEYTGVEGAVLQPQNFPSLFSSDLPPDKAAHWDSRMEPQSTSVFTTAVRSTCWSLDIPITYVTCTKDSQAGVKGALVAKMRKANWRMKTVEAGHGPFLGCLKELGNLILQSGRKVAGQSV